jgi:trehalose 6-phosphate phosphatase
VARGEDDRDLPPPLRAVRAHPRRAAVLTDFDGTLAPVVADPDRAVPLPGVASTLAKLAAGYAVVAVVSGRPVSFLMERLADAGPAVRLFGVHGFEWSEGGVVVRHPQAEPWRDKAQRVVTLARAAFEGTGVGIEDKGATVAVHWRRAPGAGAAVLAQSPRWAEETGLVAQTGRQIVEFRPPLPIDKGSVVEELALGCAAACFMGDDAGDLAAFAALDRLGASGMATARVAVADAESPPELVAAADVVVPGPAEALALLRVLAHGVDGD